MKYFGLFPLYLIIYFNKIKLTFQSYVVYPFKKSTKLKKIFPENLIQNDLEVTIKIGTPPQNVALNLRSGVYTFYVTSSKVNLGYPTFNESSSTSLIKETDKPSNFSKMEYIQAYKIYDSIIINEKEVKNISLFLATSVAYNQSGALGLKLVDSHEVGDDLSFIYQIKKLANFDYYSFVIKYDDDNQGELIIGSYPHLYDKNYNENNFYFTKAGVIGKNVDWVLNFDVIRYDNKTIGSIITKCLIQIEYGLIRAPYKLKKFFNEKYFNNRCREEFYLLRNLYIIHCNKNIPINEFKNLSFTLKDIDYIFTLTYKDLFIERNNEYIFSIVFDTNINTNNQDGYWILGKPFIKKYSLIYDLDRKIIGLYKENDGNEIDEKNKFKSNNYLYVFLILLVISIFVIIGLVIYIIFYINKTRKKKANELIDDFDYIPTE